jgi:hypothetical protein
MPSKSINLPLGVQERQRAFCRERGYEFVPTPGDSKLGFAIRTKGAIPINGLRHPAVGDTNGWHIWCGEEFSEESDFFAPLHAQHLYDDYPELIPLLGLGPGCRFLLAGDYLDVWYDPSLLNI